MEDGNRKILVNLRQNNKGKIVAIPDSCGKFYLEIYPKLSYEDFDREIIAINQRLIALCAKYKVKNGLYAQWISGKYVIGQNLTELAADSDNELKLSISLDLRS